MAKWGEVAKSRNETWDKPVEETDYLEEIAEYWERVAKGESYEKINSDIGRRAWEEKGIKNVKKVDGNM